MCETQKETLTVKEMQQILKIGTNSANAIKLTNKFQKQEKSP